MAQDLENCKEYINFFNYFEIMYCVLSIHEWTTEIGWMILLLVAAFGYLLLMEVVIDRLFAPILKICSVKLRMSEYLAGITFLAFGNCSGELIGNFLPIRRHGANVTCAFSSALTTLLLSGGLICFCKPIKMHEFSSLMNLLLLFLAVMLIDLIIYNDYRVGQKEAIIILCLYVVYLVMNVSDVLFVKYTIKKLALEVGSPKTATFQKETHNKKVKLLRLLKESDAVIVSDRRAKYENRGNRDKIISQETLNKQNYETFRTIFYSKSNPKNHLLFYDLLESVNPYDAVEWQLSNCIQRLVIVVEMPLVLIVNLLVPVVDYEKNKHGWCKLLNCVQIVTSSFILITMVHSKFASVYRSWYIELNFLYSMWSFCLTVPLACCVFFHARTDVPPRYHDLFIALSGPSALFIGFVCVAETEILTSIVGVILHLSDGFVAITIGALSNTSMDLISNYKLTMQGYGKMAFASICAQPFLLVVVGLSVSFLTNKNVEKKDSYYWLYGEHGDNSYIFLLITILTLLWWCITLNFCTRRSMGLFLWVLYFLFLLFSFGAEFDVWDEFAWKIILDPK